MINESLEQTLSKHQNQTNYRSQSQHIHQIQDENPNKILRSAESRVKSQWEKTLQGQSRNYLDQIHQEIEEKRSLSTVDDESINNENQSIMDERRLLLKRKQIERQKLKDQSC